ncbi:MAG: helix-turn-helix domain-containing protein [Litorimonas sp.]
MTRPKTQDPTDPMRARIAVAATALEFGVPDLDVGRPDIRGPLVDFARQVAMYLTQCLYGMNARRVGELFGRDRSTVTHAVRVVEESRNDPLFDAKLARLERWLGAAPV